MDVMEQGLRSEELLRAGEYAEGFRLYEAWRAINPGKWHDFPMPRWTGQDIRGQRLLITGEQGFGDQIMYARFAKLLLSLGVDLVWLCEPTLERLLNESLGIPAASLASGRDLGEFSVHCPSCSLASPFFPGLAAPPGAPYLTPPLPKTVPGRTIGVIPTGNPKHHNDANRSIPPDLAAGLLGLPGAIDLRPENTGCRTFYDTAAIVAGLELVITVDTSVAHLAGAMGKTVWVLLPHVADWRWMEGRDDSPWYASARLFRQAIPGDWAGAVERVKAALAS